MVELLSVDESQPTGYPDLGLPIEAAIVWRRIEQWCAYRWGERAVTWTVQGPGIFEPPLRPYTVDTVERWGGMGFESTTLDPSPIGLLLESGVYRIEATVGDATDTPAEVDEAARRLADYMVEVQSNAVAGHTSGQDGDYSFDRPANWAARAIHYSGAADLLRGYR